MTCSVQKDCLEIYSTFLASLAFLYQAFSASLVFDFELLTFSSYLSEPISSIRSITLALNEPNFKPPVSGFKTFNSSKNGY
jgi:hypothetical protein